MSQLSFLKWPEFICNLQEDRLLRLTQRQVGVSRRWAGGPDLLTKSWSCAVVICCLALILLILSLLEFQGYASKRGRDTRGRSSSKTCKMDVIKFHLASSCCVGARAEVLGVCLLLSHFTSIQSIICASCAASSEQEALQGNPSLPLFFLPDSLSLSVSLSL